jgi:F-type H+-transporting ATPase subunit delta
MTKNATIARPYAKALFDFALAQNRLAEWNRLLENLAAVVTTKALAKYIGNPCVSRAKKFLFLHSFCNAGVVSFSPEEMNFLKILMQKRHVKFLPDISILFKKAYFDHEGILPAKVVSAFALSDGELQKVQKTLEHKFKGKIDMTFTVDSDLIGGIVIYLEDYVIDGSIKGKLNELRLKMGQNKYVI